MATGADILNNQLAESHPAALKCMTDLGKRMYFPKGVPVQAAQAKDCRYNATIGELKSRDGHAVPLPSMADALHNLSADEVFLYQAQGGRRDLRELWKEHVAKEVQASTSLPVVCMGLTHGLSVCADLFIDDDTDVLIPEPCWGNYYLLFKERPNGRLLPYSVMEHTQDCRDAKWNIAGIEQRLNAIQNKGVLVLNIPNNPVGYTPTKSEIAELIVVLKACTKPLVIVLDEAYKGMEWTEDCYPGSIAQELADLDPKQFLVVKIDGATKELFFFGGRVAFITFLTNTTSAAVLEEKAIGCIRSTVSALPSPSQAMVVKALKSPTIDAEVGEIRAMLKARFEELQRVCVDLNVPVYPFNSAFFALIHTQHDPEEMRLRLLQKGVGVISVPSASALRVSYSTVDIQDIRPMMEIITQMEAEF